jgi:hypothetical protein
MTEIADVLDRAVSVLRGRTMADLATRPTTWALGSTSPKKRIHLSTCRYARRPYHYLGERSEYEVYRLIVEGGAAEWHDACRLCAPDLDDALAGYSLAIACLRSEGE